MSARKLLVLHRHAVLYYAKSFVNLVFFKREYRTTKKFKFTDLTSNPFCYASFIMRNELEYPSN